MIAVTDASGRNEKITLHITFRVEPNILFLIAFSVVLKIHNRQYANLIIENELKHFLSSFIACYYVVSLPEVVLRERRHIHDIPDMVQVQQSI